MTEFDYFMKKNHDNTTSLSNAIGISRQYLFKGRKTGKWQIEIIRAIAERYSLTPEEIYNCFIFPKEHEGGVDIEENQPI